MKNYAMRLMPGEELKSWIKFFVQKENIKAGSVLTCVGSLSKLEIRLADGETIREYNEDFEIVSLVGTLSQDGCHIHISVADREGKVIGGHLKKGVVNTTAEIVLTTLDGFEFKREYDSKTNFKELFVKHFV